MENERKYRYFLYSQTLEKNRSEAEAKLSKVFVPGKILVNGDWQPFTNISSTPDNIMYPDMKIVAKGYLDELKFIEPTTAWKAGV